MPAGLPEGEVENAVEGYVRQVSLRLARTVRFGDALQTSQL